MQQGLLGRISRSAVKEYHAFGIISYVSCSRFGGYLVSWADGYRF